MKDNNRNMGKQSSNPTSHTNREANLREDEQATTGRTTQGAQQKATNNKAQEEDSDAQKGGMSAGSKGSRSNTSSKSKKEGLGEDVENEGLRRDSKQMNKDNRGNANQGNLGNKGGHR